MRHARPSNIRRQHSTIPRPRASSQLHHALLLLLIALLTHPTWSAAKVVQVQVIHRHGARPPLTKHPFDPSQETPTASASGALYERGAMELQQLGAFVRSEYFSTTPLDPIDVQSYSSNLPRTLLSARAFLAGLFESDKDSARVATMVFNASSTDWRIRGYALCPALTSKFESFTKTSEYKERKRADESFIREITASLPKSSSKTTSYRFEDVFNIYDRYMLVREGYTDDPDGSWPLLPDPKFKRLKALADWFESRKFHFETHGLPVAAGLLRTIVAHARAFESKTSRATRFKLVEYSAHYPTLLTLLAAIRRERDDKPDDPADAIPAFGAALLVELHDDDEGGKLHIKLRWASPNNKRSEDASTSDSSNNNGDSSSSSSGGGGGDVTYVARAIAVDQPGCGDAAAGCAMSTIERAWALNTLGLARFCDQCGSQIGACYAGRDGKAVTSGGDESSAAAAAATDAVRCGGGRRVTIAAVGAVIGVILGLGGGLAYMSWSSRRKAAAMAWEGAGGSIEGDIRA